MAITEIMDKEAIRRTIVRLSHEVEEKNADLSSVAFIGVRRGGEIVARRVAEHLFRQTNRAFPCAGIDISRYRDDTSSLDYTPCDFGFSVEGKTVVLCDDVLQTGRSVRAALAGIFATGRPAGVQLLVLADRGGREVPVKADYVGKNVPAAIGERIEVEFSEYGKEDRMYLTRLN